MALKPSPGRKGDPVWLPDALREFGVNVVEDAGWKEWGNGDFGTIWGVIVHHTGSNNTSANYIRYNPGLGNALSSQIHLSRDGVATLVGAGVAWHAGRGSYPGLPTDNANWVTIGIEAQGDGQTWPAEQMEAYYRICAAIIWYLGLPVERVISHWEYSMKAQGKWDPGLNGKPMPMAPFRAEVQKRLDNHKNGAVNEVPSNTNSSEDTGMLFKQITDFIKGYLGPQIDALQEVWRQLRGPNGNGWAQLGQNAKGQNLSLVDAIAAIRHDIAALDAKINELKKDGK